MSEKPKKVTCECGATVGKSYLYLHKRKSLHKRNMKKLSEPKLAILKPYTAERIEHSDT